MGFLRLLPVNFHQSGAQARPLPVLHVNSSPWTSFGSAGFMECFFGDWTMKKWDFSCEKWWFNMISAWFKHDLTWFNMIWTIGIWPVITHWKRGTMMLFDLNQWRMDWVWEWRLALKWKGSFHGESEDLPSKSGPTSRERLNLYLSALPQSTINLYA